MKAKDIIESEYGVRLSDGGDYLKQLARHEASGLLADMRLHTRITLRLCALIDDLQTEIASLKTPQSDIIT